MTAQPRSGQPALAGRFGRFHETVAHWAATRPDSPAILEGDQTLTYAALDQLVQQIADALSGAGLRPRDRILIVAENATSSIALVTAANRLGACCSILATAGPTGSRVSCSAFIAFRAARCASIVALLLSTIARPRLA